VYRQAAGLREGSAAGGAGVGAVAGMGAHVLRQVAGRRECVAAGGAGVGAVAGMGAHVYRQVAGLRAGLAADGALKEELTPRPTPPPLARGSRAHTRFLISRLLPSPLAPEHRQIRRHVFRETDSANWSNKKPNAFSGISDPMCKEIYCTFALARDHPGLLGHWKLNWMDGASTGCDFFIIAFRGTT